MSRHSADVEVAQVGADGAVPRGTAEGFTLWATQSSSPCTRPWRGRRNGQHVSELYRPALPDWG